MNKPSFKCICFPCLLRATLPLNSNWTSHETSLNFNVPAFLACWGLLCISIQIEILMTSAVFSMYLVFSCLLRATLPFNSSCNPYDKHVVFNICAFLSCWGSLAFKFQLKSELNTVISGYVLSLLAQGYLTFRSTCLSILFEFLMNKLSFRCVCCPCLLRATCLSTPNWNPYWTLWFQGFCFPYLLRVTLPFNPLAFQFKLKSFWASFHFNVFAFLACSGLLDLSIQIEILITSALFSRYLLSLTCWGLLCLSIHLQFNSIWNPNEQTFI